MELYRHHIRLLALTLAPLALAGFVGSAYAINLESWDDKIAGAARWKVLSEFNNEAVLDKETQLVWERSPAVTAHTWSSARIECTRRTTGNRKGWRLPSVHELASLVEPSVTPPGPTLPPGHPFVGVQSAPGSWSATTSANDSTSAWGVAFSSGLVFTYLKSNGMGFRCVRGGQSHGEMY